MILAGDIGGTKTDLAVFEARGEALVERRAQRFESRSHDDFASLVREFLSGGRESIERAGFGVAGPVVEGRGEPTNLTWAVDSRDLARLLPAASVVLVNDLVATAAGVVDLSEQQLVTLHAGEPRNGGTRAVLAPGTGLGESTLAWDGNSYHALASEGGHADFAARDEEEVALLRYLLTRFPRVSYERVLSGPAFSHIYDFLRDSGAEEEPDWLGRELAQAEDRNAAITGAALEGRARICERTLARWVAICGAEAGNLALRAVAEGGVYLAGGIVPRIVQALRDRTFLDAYLAKEPLNEFVARVPVRVVLERRTALLGAARLAARG